jgi:polar amino acid transport system substrate-binding protein
MRIPAMRPENAIVLAMLLLGTLQAQDFTILSSSTGVELAVLRSVSGAVFKRLDLPVTVTETPAERALIDANAGIGDADGLRVELDGKDYPNLIRVPELFMVNEFVGFSKDPSVRLDGWESTTNYRIGYIIGWKSVEYNIVNLIFATKPSAVASGEQLFRMLDSDKISLAIFAKADGVKILASMPLRGIAPIEKPLAIKPMYLYVHRKHADLVPRLDATLRQMKSDGSYDALISQAVR